MNFRINCKDCDVSYTITDTYKELIPNGCCYCGGDNIEVLPIEGDRPNLYDAYVYLIETYIENNLNENNANKISEDDIDTMADNMCSDDQLSNYIQEEISDRIHDLLEDK